MFLTKFSEIFQYSYTHVGMMFPIHKCEISSCTLAPNHEFLFSLEHVTTIKVNFRIQCQDKILR